MRDLLRSLFFTLLLCTSFSVWSQENTFEKADSLIKEGYEKAFLNELYEIKSQEDLIKDPEEHLKLYVKLMEYFRIYQFDHDSIIKYYNIGNQLATDYHNQEYLYNFEFMWGTYLMNTGKYKEGLLIFQKICPIVEENNYSYLPHLYDSYARLFYLLKDYQKAYSYLKKEAQIFKEQGNLANTSATYNNLGVLYISENMLDSALVYHNLSQEINFKLKDSINIVRSYNNLGRAYYKLSKYKKADSLFQLALNYDHNRVNLGLLVNYANLLIDQNNLEEAELFLLNAIERNPIKHTKKSALAQLVRVKKEQNKYKEALAYSEELRLLSEELLDETKVKELERLTVEYETNQKEQEISSLKKINTKQQQLLSKNRLLIIVSSALLVLIGLLLALYFKNKNFQSKVEKMLMEQKLLHSKMNPHFIFNSLSNIQSNILQDQKEVAVKYLVKFSKLLRYNLEQSTHDTALFEDEIKSIRDYLEMQNLRLNGNLEYVINVDEELEQDTDIYIPGMMMQPIVENALEHGLEGVDHPRIEIDVQDKDDHLHITFIDNGVGYSRTQNKKNPNKTSHASKILNRRLEILAKKLNLNLYYEIADNLDQNQQIIGTKATLVIPITSLQE
ncbi:histidine kinase [Lishizhenia sp.]|uniref:tetratricopeptide repeat-containing sensor histidine kinase n=1 Tax=Lishizhenia sp. TaxID=2497594 RepID=UPI00299E8F57|nr:histidine kinase [Lishizhenia sp.]MDX1447253.1 histidine kinase [Lishizhenia sp.]